MSKNEFDELLLKKLREEDLEYEPANWDRLSQLLPPSLAAPSVNKGKKWALASGIAAAIALALATVFFIKLMEKENTVPDSNQPSLSQSSQPGTPSVSPPAVEEQTKQAPSPSIAPKPATRNTGLYQASNKKPGTGNLRDVVVPEGRNQEDVYVKETIQDTEAPLTARTQPETPAPEKLKEENSAPSIAKNQGDKVATEPVFVYNNSNNYPSAFYEGRRPGGYSNTTAVGVGGGMNYGNMNAGYAVGISARTKLVGDFFVDGTVAMLYNNNTVNTGVNNGPGLTNGDNNLAARPAEFKNTVPTPALSPIQKLYYVQFNPSIGYQVEKHVALSVGGDFQRMLNKEPEVVQQVDNNAKVLPGFDVGITTKSEFSITPSIQAGLVYREGLNNLFKSGGSQYVNRRYVQVQFKYNLPIR